MWAGITGSAALLVLLLARGWGSDAWATAAGVLLVVCVLVCASAATQGRAASREVSRAVARLAAARDEEQRRRAPTRETTDGR